MVTKVFSFSENLNKAYVVVAIRSHQAGGRNVCSACDRTAREMFRQYGHKTLNGFSPDEGTRISPDDDNEDPSDPVRGKNNNDCRSTRGRKE